jgi:Family of unknown function (DUF5947)
MDDSEVRERIAALESRLERLSPDAVATIAALSGLYGEALRRMAAAAQNAPRVLSAFTADELIAHMMALHDVALQAPPARMVGQLERCDLCNEELSDTHPHLYDTSEKTILCACAVCALLFPQRVDASGRYRFISENATYLESFDFDAATWSALEIPVGIAYFIRSQKSDRIVAYYPSPAGAVESTLKLDAWRELERKNPALNSMVADTQALLVNGTGAQVEGWIVGIDACYRLIALIRAHWRGLRGGEGVRTEIKRFFEELGASARTNRFGGSHVIKGAV